MAYTNSSLVTYKKISPHKTPSRNHEIDCITIHCIVGQWTAKQGCDYFATASAGCSANYVVGKDGSIGLSVEEKDRSWCTSSSSNDNRAVTIEVASDTTHPYAVTDKAFEALIELIADICKRNDIKELKWKGDKSLIGQTDKQNMTVHRWFANKACPGEYLYSRHGYIAEQVNKKLGVNAVEPVVPPTTIKLEFKVGDIVNFAGGKHYGSTNAASGTDVKASKAKVTNLYESGKHPYHIRAINDAGSFIACVYGWVDASSVSVIQNTKPSSTQNVIDTIKEVQVWVNKNYKYGIAEDGVYGAKTKKALVKALQTEINKTYNKKLLVDGIWGSQTSAACPTLKIGAKNSVVGVLQALLICNKYKEVCLDNDYGSVTANAVLSCQNKNGLVPDKAAGKQTFAKLCV